MLFLLLGHESGFFQFLFIFEVISDTSIIIYIRTQIRHLMHKSTIYERSFIPCTKNIHFKCYQQFYTCKKKQNLLEMYLWSRNRIATTIREILTNYSLYRNIIFIWDSICIKTLPMKWPCVSTFILQLT